MDLEKMATMMEDPIVKDKLMQRKTVLTDENGETYEVIKMGNVVMPVTILQQGKDAPMKMRNVKQLPLRDDDVLLCSFAKTGTHWISNLLHYLMKTGPLEDATSYAPPLIDMFSPEVLSALPSPRVLPTHFLPDSLPTDVAKKGTKIVMAFRNPKDTAVSLFHFLKGGKQFGNFNLSWNCFIENWMLNLIPPSDYFNYYNTWQTAIEEQKELDIIVVNYEDLKKDGVGELRRIQEHLGLSHSNERLQQVLDKCSINNLRAEVNNKKVTSPLVNSEGKSVLYRKGIIGDWKNHLTVAQNEQFDELVNDRFKNSIFKWQVTA